MNSLMRCASRKAKTKTKKAPEGAFFMFEIRKCSSLPVFEVDDLPDQSALPSFVLIVPN